MAGGAVRGMAAAGLGRRLLDQVDAALHRGESWHGDPEAFGVWTSQGRMFSESRDAAVANDLPHTAFLRGPAQFGIGRDFQTAGIPQIGAIAGLSTTSGWCTPTDLKCFKSSTSI